MLNTSPAIPHTRSFRLVFDARGPHNWGTPGQQKCPHCPHKPARDITPCQLCGRSKGCCLENWRQCSANKGVLPVVANIATLGGLFK